MADLVGSAGRKKKKGGGQGVLWEVSGRSKWGVKEGGGVTISQSPLT